MAHEPKRDWAKTRIHFFCGTILGAALSWSAGGGVWAIYFTALVLGLIAGCFLDGFWDAFLDWWRGF